MGDQYFIVIKNKSTEVQNYLLFNDPPTQGSLGTPYSNVWQRSNGVFSPNGTGKFSITTASFAVCGTTVSKKALGLKVQIDTSDSATVTLATDKKPGTAPNMAVVSGGAGFNPPPGTVTLPSSFGINTASFDANQYKDIWCGLGKYDEVGEIVAVVSWRAFPTKGYVITPTIKFWVSTGSFERGLVVDKTIFGAISEIDFTGANGNVATIIHKSDGTYSDPVFSYSTHHGHKETLTRDTQDEEEEECA